MRSGCDHLEPQVQDAGLDGIRGGFISSRQVSPSSPFRQNGDK